MEQNPFYCMRYYVTFRCNSRCAYCNVWQDDVFRGVEELPLDRARELIRQCWEIGVRYIDFTGGEPTQYRALPELIGYARELGIKTEVTTNGVCRDREQLKALIPIVDKLNLSLDTLDRGKYRTVRGVDGQEAAVKALETISQGRREHGCRPPKMMVAVSEENEGELDALLQFAGDHQTEVYLNPVFPYFSGNRELHMQRYIQKILQQTYKPWAVVMLHFLEFYLDGGSQSGVPCSANRQTLTVAPDGSVMMPCYHAVQKWIPWDRPMSQMLALPEVQAWKRDKPCRQCELCAVSPYFGISFNYWLDKYFLLQSYSEKLHHLKEKYLNHIPELDWDTNVLDGKLQELLRIVRSLKPIPRKADGGLFAPEVYRDPAQHRQQGKDCWELTGVPHQEFDRICDTVYQKVFSDYCRGIRKEDAAAIFQNAMEFQLRWWCYYISKHFSVSETCDLDAEEQWLREYTQRLDRYAG